MYLSRHISASRDRIASGRCMHPDLKSEGEPLEKSALGVGTTIILTVRPEEPLLYRLISCQLLKAHISNNNCIEYLDKLRIRTTVTTGKTGEFSKVAPVVLPSHIIPLPH